MLNSLKYKGEIKGENVRLISTGPDRVLIGDAQSKMRLMGPHRAAL